MSLLHRVHAPSYTEPVLLQACLLTGLDDATASALSGPCPSKHKLLNIVCQENKSTNKGYSSVPGVFLSLDMSSISDSLCLQTVEKSIGGLVKVNHICFPVRRLLQIYSSIGKVRTEVWHSVVAEVIPPLFPPFNDFLLSSHQLLKPWLIICWCAQFA